MPHSHSLRGFSRRVALRSFGGLMAAAVAGCAISSSPDDALLKRARAARFVLLGEVHDNAEQHRLRAELLRALLADGRPTRVVFEQMERGAAIDPALRDADAVVDAGRLDRRSWGWPLHRPLIEAAMAGAARITGGDLSRDEMRAVVRNGDSAAPAELKALLDRQRWSEVQQASLARSIEEAHCGALPTARVPAMVLAQRVRDAALAQAMLAAPVSERVVLIAGNGHVRKDVAVPQLLLAAGVSPREILVVGYLEPGFDDEGVFDVVRITPAASREDPCAAFRSAPAGLPAVR
jgi:uncharacterized iron-regulated protein